MFPSHGYTKIIQRQRGFLLPLALFILVVMGVLALTISRTSIQTQTSTIQEFTNIQAFYAAESGAQRGMQALFFDNNNRKDTDEECANLNINHNFPDVDGLKICNVAVTCQCKYRNGNPCDDTAVANYSLTAATDVIMSTYTLESTGSCGQDQYRAERIIQVGAFLEQE